MGWRLAVEILEHCPDIKYRQFRVLVSFALDANDDTRQGMPGMEKLTLQANCKMRQTKQAMADLRDLGILKTVHRSAPGRRAVYEMVPMCTGNGCGHTRTRTGAETASTGADSAPTGADIPAPSKSLLLSHRPESSLSDVRAALEAAGATERETDSIISKIRNNPKIQSKAAYLRQAIANGDAGELITEARADLELVDRLERIRPETRSTNGARSSTPPIPATSISVLCGGEQHDECEWAHCRCRCHVTAQAKAELERIRQEKRP